MLLVLSELGNNMRAIQKADCFEALGDVMQFVLTLFVHEEFIDNKLLYSILKSSSHLYMLIPGSRKRYLYQILNEHSIWQSELAWTQCISFDLKEKVDQALERRR